MNDKLYGANKIAEYMQLVGDYPDLAALLRVFRVPKMVNDKQVETYCMTKAQADVLKGVINDMRVIFKTK